MTINSNQVPCKLDSAEEFYKRSKEKIFKDAIEGLISLAVPLPLVGGLFVNLAGEKQTSNDFPQNNYDFAFAYIHANLLKAHKEMILSRGEIPLHAVEHFKKQPNGHSLEQNYQKNNFQIHFLGESAERVWQDRAQDKAVPIYLTVDAILSCPRRDFFSNFLTTTQAKIPQVPKSNKNMSEWELEETEYMKLKAHELIPLVMKSLNIDPMAYPPQHNKSGLKKELHSQGRKLFNKRFRMNLESFSKGNTSAWVMAKNNNLIREE